MCVWGSLPGYSGRAEGEDDVVLACGSLAGADEDTTTDEGKEATHKGDSSMHSPGHQWLRHQDVQGGGYSRSWDSSLWG